jgi:hypothetical protein
VVSPRDSRDAFARLVAGENPNRFHGRRWLQAKSIAFAREVPRRRIAPAFRNSARRRAVRPGHLGIESR